ncbi:MAG: energy-coupling factor ABC transporter ATP-binding protein [Acetivibrionales bacterium]|jgi:cobalt/nickel transport system ATP-binding protein
MNEIIIEARELSFEYPDGTPALRDVSLKIRKGSKVAVLGSNGSGKSTLFMNFNGVLKPTGGRLFFKGREVGYSRSSLINLRKSVGIVFQDPDSQLFSASVLQEVSFGPVNLRMPQDTVKERVDNALKELGIYNLRDRPVHFLSYGQKKMVTIADILVMEPELIIFDEPTACLDPKHTLNIIELFDRINQKGVTVIISTHDIDMAYSWADYIIVMKEGRIEMEGKPEDIFEDRRLLERAGLVKPVVLEIYRELRRKGIIEENLPVPRNKEKLLEMIKSIRKTGIVS